MSVIADRTGGTLGNLDELLARDVRDTERHTGLSGVEDPALRVALEQFDCAVLTNDVSVVLPSLSAFDLFVASEHEPAEDVAAVGHAVRSWRSLVSYVRQSETDIERDAEVPLDPKERTAPEAGHISGHAHGAGRASDARGGISAGASDRIALGAVLPAEWMDARVMRNLFVHGSEAAIRVWTSVALDDPRSFALRLVLPGRWATEAPLLIVDEVASLAGRHEGGSVDLLVEEPHVVAGSMQAIGAANPANSDDDDAWGTVVPDDGDAVTTVRTLVGVLDLPLRDVLKAAGIRRSSFHSWDKPNRPQPRTQSLGRLWALAQAVQDLSEMLDIRLGRWMLADQRRYRTLLEGEFDSLVEMAARALFPTSDEVTPATAESAVRPDDGSLLFEGHPSAGGAQQRVAQRASGRRNAIDSQVGSRRRSTPG
ncbi:MAG: hypothetical protein QM747_12125 [Nocardioides sp.]